MGLLTLCIEASHKKKSTMNADTTDRCRSMMTGWGGRIYEKI
jgi:hypothetical protein